MIITETRYGEGTLEGRINEINANVKLDKEESAFKSKIKHAFKKFGKISDVFSYLFVAAVAGVHGINAAQNWIYNNSSTMIVKMNTYNLQEYKIEIPLLLFSSAWLYYRFATGYKTDIFVNHNE